jgi:hypothetical protein
MSSKPLSSVRATLKLIERARERPLSIEMKLWQSKDCTRSTRRITPSGEETLN